MSTTETVRAWSATAASNNTSDAAITSADTQSPDTLDNNIRSIMAAVRKQMDDIGGKLVAGGTANALTVTTGQVLESGQLVDGLALAIEAASTNTSATVTFAPDGLTAANIKRADGTALAIGSIKSGMRLLLQYDAGASEWRCANIPPVTAGALGSALASFSAHKNGSTQAVATNAATKVTFGTEASDVGAHFASSTWTPPAGTVLMIVGMAFTSLTSGATTEIFIYKNGAALRSYYIDATTIAGDSGFPAFSTMDSANGSDTYEVYVQSSDSSYTIQGSSQYTWFQGTMI